MPNLLHKLPGLQLLWVLQQAHLYRMLCAPYIVNIRAGGPLPILQERQEQRQGARGLSAVVIDSTARCGSGADVHTCCTKVELRVVQVFCCLRGIESPRRQGLPFQPTSSCSFSRLPPHLDQTRAVSSGAT